MATGVDTSFAPTLIPTEPTALHKDGPLPVNDFHNLDDVDQGPFAHHHTLGYGPDQAAPGNHTHTGLGTTFQSTTGIGIPNTYGRHAGDIHYNESDAYEYVLAGTEGNVYVDSFDEYTVGSRIGGQPFPGMGANWVDGSTKGTIDSDHFWQYGVVGVPTLSIAVPSANTSNVTVSASARVNPGSARSYIQLRSTYKVQLDPYDGSHLQVTLYKNTTVLATQKTTTSFFSGDVSTLTISIIDSTISASFADVNLSYDDVALVTTSNNLAFSVQNYVWGFKDVYVDVGGTYQWYKVVPSGLEIVNSVTSSGTSQIIPDPAVGGATLNRIVLTNNCSLSFPTAAAGKSFSIEVAQDATGGRSITWPASVRWPNNITPSQVTTPSKSDLYTFVCIDGSSYIGLQAAQNIGA